MKWIYYNIVSALIVLLAGYMVFMKCSLYAVVIVVLIAGMCSVGPTDKKVAEDKEKEIK